MKSKNKTQITKQQKSKMATKQQKRRFQEASTKDQEHVDHSEELPRCSSHDHSMKHTAAKKKGISTSIILTCTHHSIVDQSTANVVKRTLVEWGAGFGDGDAASEERVHVVDCLAHGMFWNAQE